MAVRTKKFYPIQGMEKVLRNLNRVSRRVEGRTKSGLVQAGLLVFRDAKKMAPRDLGNLWNSGYVVWHKPALTAEEFAKQLDKLPFTGRQRARLTAEREQIMLEDTAKAIRAATHHEFIVVIGFTANYAIYVHEDLEASHPPKRVKRRIEKWGEEAGGKNPGEAKFLLKSLEQNQGRIIQILVNRARIK